MNGLQLLVWIMGIVMNALVEGLSESLLTEIVNRTERWFVVRSQNSKFQGLAGEYLEGSVETFIALLKRDQQRGISHVLILVKVLGYASILVWTAGRLWVNDLLYLLAVFQKVAVLATTFDGSFNTNFLQMRHLIDRCGGAYLVLDARGRVRHWDQSAQDLFQFRARQVVDKVATRSFIPSRETGGRPMTAFLKELCNAPDHYRLHLNENVTASRQRFWTLWLNLPVYERDRVQRIHCIGFKVTTPRLVRLLISIWYTFPLQKRSRAS